MIDNVKLLKDNIINKYHSFSIEIKATLWFLVCNVLQKGISVVTTPIFTRIMTTGEYGTFNVFISWQGIITAICILTLPWGVYTQGLVKYDEIKDKFTSVLIGLMTSMCIIWVIIYASTKSVLNRYLGLSTALMLVMFVTIWSSSVIDFWSMKQRIELKYKKLVIVTLIISILNPTVGIFLVRIMRDKAVGRALAIALVQMSFAIFLFIQLIKKGKCLYNRALWKYALYFNGQLIPHYLSQRVLNSADRIMIERMDSLDSAGIYSLAYSVSIIMTMVSMAMSQAISPWVYKRIKENKINEIHTVGYPSLIIVAVCNLLLIALAPEIVKLFAPAPYYDAIWIIPPVAMSTFYIFMYGLFADFEFYYEKMRFMSIATIIVAIMNIGLNYVFIKLFGYYAAGYTTLFCYLCYASFHYYVMRFICLKNTEQPYSVKILNVISTVFTGVGFSIQMTYNNIVIRYSLLIGMFIVAIIYRKMIAKYVKRIFGARKVER